jgi:signal transduction histidine kinase
MAKTDSPAVPVAAGTARPHRRVWLRRPEMALVAAVALLGLLALVRSLVQAPYIDATWRTEGRQIELASSPLPLLAPMSGMRLQRIEGGDGRGLAADADLLQRSPRWSVGDASRQRQTELQRQLSAVLAAGPVTLHFEQHAPLRIAPAARGLLGLGAFFWLLAGTALALVLVSALVLLAHPRRRNVPYALIALSQAANLLAIGIETLPGLGWPEGWAQHGLGARMACDLISAAALVHLATLQPLRLPAGRWIAGAAWGACAALLAWQLLAALPLAWWWTQAAMLGCGLATIGLMSWSYRLEPNPFALLMRRLAGAATATLLLLSLAMAVAARQDGIVQGDASFASVVWYLFLAMLILLLPMFSRTQPLMRELALLAGTSTVATSLDLLFVAALSLGAFASLSLSVFFALAAYAGTRRWLLQPMGGQHEPGAERMFERLYRVLREVEARPRDSAELMTRLLRELFEPLQVQTLDRAPSRSRVLGDGAALLVPLPAIDAEHGSDADGAIVLRFAERGKRMFSRDDARLTDRVVEQLRRAVAYDKAVERGRSEERARIAQDLHDDIGARLLTLMYKAQTPEMEDYIRHTLKDLKTLTRGLASSDQRLSHATAEWKTDIAQRLGAAQIELTWTFAFDRDIVLGVVQWSALTRVLRELVSNVIQHSCAGHLEVSAALEGGSLRLTLADDGIGRNPQSWSHGLGLGGVRKRVKLLGGHVQWRENGSAGIVCTVVIPDIVGRH